MPRKPRKKPAAKPSPARAALVIPHRNDDKWLEWTVRNAVRIGLREIVPVEDKPAVGVSFRRDEGIMQASTPVVMVADSHMDFQPGLVEAVCEHLEKNPKDVLCVNCWGVEERDGKTVNEPGPRYGAFMHEWHEGKLLINKWHRDPTPTGEIGCILGGFYAFRRDWYIEGLGRPWSYQRGWGMCEQMLSIANWLMGGRNFCRADLWASHLFRATRADTVNVCRAEKYNTCFIVHTMVEQPHRQRLLNLIAGGNAAPTYGLLDPASADAYQQHVEARRVRTYSDLREQILHL